MREDRHPEGRLTKTQFVEQKLVGYLNSVGIKSVDTLNEEQTKDVFLQAIRNFKDEVISLDDLSFVAGKLWWSAIEKEKGFSEELLDILHVGGEINFYVRGVLRPGIDTIFLGFLKDVLQFYEDKTKGRAERAE